jgi:sec-independent protein translocase protein TatB
MFGIDSSELAVVVILALIFIGPKDLPRVMRTVGYWVGRVRGMARHFTAGIESMIREAELEEMEKRWRDENERIMRLHPPGGHYPEGGAADKMPPPGEAPEPTLPFDEKQPEDELPPEKRPLP